jgi:hypothetical protein
MTDVKLEVTQANIDQVATQAMSIISKMQDKPGNTGVQVAGAAFVFVLMCERYQLNPVDLFEMVQRMIAESDRYSRGQQLATIRIYLKEEV